MLISPALEVSRPIPCAPGGAHAAARVVVAEDDRAAHLRQAADRLGQARIEPSGAVVAVDLREHVVEQLERGDRVGGLWCGLAPSWHASRIGVQGRRCADRIVSPSGARQALDPDREACHDERVQSAPQPAYSIPALELLEEVLAQVDADDGDEGFYSRLAEAVCRLAPMRRAVIFRYDDARRRVHAAGAHGSASTASRAAIRRAGAGRRQRWPRTGHRGARRPAVTRFRTSPSSPARSRSSTCRSSPPGAGSGVILAEPEHRAAPLDERHRALLWILGKTLAPASTSRIATYLGERARELEERIDFARDIHDGVVQRLFGVSSRCPPAAAVGRGARPLRARGPRRAGRTALGAAAPARAPSAPTGTTLRRRARRLCAEHRGPRPQRRGAGRRRAGGARAARAVGPDRGGAQRAQALRRARNGAHAHPRGTLVARDRERRRALERAGRPASACGSRRWRPAVGRPRRVRRARGGHWQVRLVVPTPRRKRNL